MKRKTFTATAIAVYLSLNIEVIDDQRTADFLAFPLLSLTWLLALVWAARLKVVAAKRGVDDLFIQLRLMQTVLGIGWRSLAWGFGME